MLRRDIDGVVNLVAFSFLAIIIPVDRLFFGLR